MPQMTLVDALRYFFSPFVLFAYLAIYDPSLTQNLQSTFGPIGVVAFLVAGCVLYFVYRYLIYDPLIRWFHDIFRAQTYRRYLGDRYKIQRGKYWLPSCTMRAGNLYSQISHLNESLARETTRIRASGNHLLYQASLLTIPFILVSICKDMTQLWIFIPLGLVLCFTAVVADKSYEEEELVFLKKLFDQADQAAEADQRAKLFGYIKKI